MCTTLHNIAYIPLENEIVVERSTSYTFKVVDINDRQHSYRTAESQTLQQRVSASQY